jgi:hypothetical protein
VGLIGQQVRLVQPVEESMWTASAFNGQMAMGKFNRRQFVVQEEMSLAGACSIAYPISSSRCVVVGGV